VEIKVIPPGKPPNQLHNGLTANFWHPVEENYVLIGFRCVVQLLYVELKQFELLLKNIVLELHIEYFTCSAIATCGRACCKAAIILLGEGAAASSTVDMTTVFTASKTHKNMC
jgi:hypothetical protein